MTSYQILSRFIQYLSFSFQLSFSEIQGVGKHDSLYFCLLYLYYVEEKFCIINNNIFTENIVDLIN